MTKRRKRFHQLFKKYKYFINYHVKFWWFIFFGGVTNGFNDILKNVSKTSDSENDKKDCQFFDDITDGKKSIYGLSKATKDSEIVASFLNGLKAMVYIS